MHFFYLDESGDTGSNLADFDQPIIVLGGISVRDEGWNTTQEVLVKKLTAYLGKPLPKNFELHAKDLLSPNGDGFFFGIPIADRCSLCLELLKLLTERSHGVHYVAFNKQKIMNTVLAIEISFDHKQPYLLGFDYLITYINWLVKERLGQSARGLIILDKKDQYHEQIERLMHERRFGGMMSHRIKWVVEFSYSVDSKKNPMLQLSDLVIYCIKRFIEVEHGYRSSWPNEVKNFYARCYSLIRPRVTRSILVNRCGHNMNHLNSFLCAVRVEPRLRWQQHYNLNN
ncbi:MAG: DUF3800 domain-containing protein [Nitrospirota bacterium]